MKYFNVMLCAAMSATFVMQSCKKEEEDPFEELEVQLSYYEGDEFKTATGTSITLASNRNLEFGFLEYSDEDFTKIEMTRTINGTSTVCDVLDDQGNKRWSIHDWPATSTDYTLTVSAEDGSTKEFGPYNVTVESAATVAKGFCNLGDQVFDVAQSGSFFESRHYMWGGGSAGSANYYSVLAQTHPRLIDFVALTDNGVFKAVSPDQHQSIHSFDRLVNDCGYQTTTFSSYSGSLDPSSSEDIPLADILALPDPTESEMIIQDSSMFVFKTSDGKKGLIMVSNLTELSGGNTCTLHFACEQ